MATDVIVHRLLGASINHRAFLSSNIMDKGKIDELCANLNFRHRMAQQASRSSVELYTQLYFRGKVLEEEGHVIRVLRNGFVVLVPRLV
jgi:exosome complex exonuclease DIS3/RRP44